MFVWGILEFFKFNNTKTVPVLPGCFIFPFSVALKGIFAQNRRRGYELQLKNLIFAGNFASLSIDGQAKCHDKGFHKRGL